MSEASLDQIVQQGQAALDALATVTSAAALDEFRVKYLGRKGIVTDLRSLIGKLPGDQRAAAGKVINEVAKKIEGAFAEKQDAIGSAVVSGPLNDVTLPGTRPNIGRPHVLRQTMRELSDIFGRMGFEVIDAPEVEDEWHNFIALNIPEKHPARDPLDNFYIDETTLLRTQTSTAQVRVMSDRKPPVRVVHYGRVYRPDTIDATHHMMFHQIECLCVDTDITMIDMKSTILNFCRVYFGPEVTIRLRPSYFPFTEPSAEVDMTCMLCHGKGCKVCGLGWIELGGCGMVDPDVFRAVGYDPDKYTGFAFGFGIERMAMRRHRIRDIRLFYENDMRFLNSF